MNNLKSSYNERFSFSDPSISTCRSTKHRTAKRKKTQFLVAEASAEASNLVSDDVDSGTTRHRVTRTTAIENHGEEEAFDILHTHYQDDCFVPLDHDCINQDPARDPGTVTTDEISGEGQEFELNYDDHPQSIEYNEMLPPSDGLEYLSGNDENPGDSDSEHMHAESEVADGEISLHVQTQPSVRQTQPKAMSDIPLYEGSSLTIASSSVLLMKYAMKHNLTREALKDLLHLIKLYCPSPNTCPNSLHHFKKNFHDMKYVTVTHSFCNSCFHEVTFDSEQPAICSNVLCKSELIDKKSVCSFLEIPVDLQLKSILESKQCPSQYM